MPLFVQAEVSLGLPIKRTTKPSLMKHQQELHTQGSQIQYLIFYGARNKLPRLKKRNPSSEGMASSRIKSGLSVTQLVHLVCGVKGVDSSLFQATHLFVLQCECQPELLDPNQDTQRQEKHLPTNWSTDENNLQLNKPWLCSSVFLFPALSP